MDKDLKNIIDETIQNYFNNPVKMIEKGVRQETYDVCPHCKTEIYEKHEYTEDGGKTWRHSDCKGLIERPPLKPSELAAWEKFLNPLMESELPLSGEKKYICQEPGGQMAAVNTNEAAFRIYNTNLCPDLWDEQQHLNPEVRVNLLKMAYDFYKKTKIVAPILDVYLMGSIANYNWTPDSDADVHVIIDFSQMQMPGETASKVAKSAGAQWNNEHNVTVKGHKVEINIQSVNAEKPHVTGIYSLVKATWVRKPQHMDVQINRPLIQSKYAAMKRYLEFTIQSGDREAMKVAKDYLDDYRQYGLDTGGEISTENIVYKILRSKGLIKKLKDSITSAYDQEMTVIETDDSDEDKEHEEAMRYFSVGQEDDENVDNSYCWIWSKQDQAIKSAKGGTHSLNFGGPHVKDYTYSGWFDPSKNAVSVVFPKHERDKLTHPPTVDDIPSQIYSKLVSKFKLNSPRFEIFESFVSNSLKDYIGGIVDGEVRAAQVEFGKSKYYVHRDFPGLYSGQNSTNWRYQADKNRVLWNTEPDPSNKPKVDDFLEKRGIKNPSHRVMYSGVAEITQKDIKAKYPLPQALYGGKEKLELMTLGNLKSQRDKAKRTLDDLAYRYKEDPSIIQVWQDRYEMYDNEIKRRLKYINKPVFEHNNQPDLKQKELDDNLAQIKPENIQITVQHVSDNLEYSNVQADGVLNGKNVFSSNPDTLRKNGVDILSTAEFKKLPQGRYWLPDAITKLKSLNEMPQINRVGKTVMANDKPLKNMELDEVRGNIVLIRANTDGLIAKGYTLAYFMDSEESAQLMANGKIAYLMIPRGTFHSGGNPITDIWKKRFQSPGTEHILGVLEGNTSDEMIYIDMLTVRPGYQRNRIGTLLLKTIKHRFPKAKITTSPSTDAGAKFKKAHGLNEGTDGTYNAAANFDERRDEQMCEIARFLKDNPVEKHIPWNTIPATLLKKTWLIFGKHNLVDVNDIDKIADRILTNIARLFVSNEFTGHITNYYMREEVADNCGIEFTEEEWDRNTWRFDNISDYGMEPLEKIYSQIFNADTPEEKLYACDKALNVVHQRSDLAEMFVEGGTSTLTKIALQGGYNAGYEYGEVNKMTRDMKEGYGAGVPETDRLHIPSHRWQIRSKDAPKTPKMKEDIAFRGDPLKVSPSKTRIDFTNHSKLDAGIGPEIRSIIKDAEKTLEKKFKQGIKFVTIEYVMGLLDDLAVIYFSDIPSTSPTIVNLKAKIIDWLSLDYDIRRDGKRIREQITKSTTNLNEGMEDLYMGYIDPSTFKVYAVRVDTTSHSNSFNSHSYFNNVMGKHLDFRKVISWRYRKDQGYVYWWPLEVDGNLPDEKYLNEVEYWIKKNIGGEVKSHRKIVSDQYSMTFRDSHGEGLTEEEKRFVDELAEKIVTGML